MRMWMVDPAVMCRKHLLGEHVELHMVTAWLIKGKRIIGWAESNCMEPKMIERRHKTLVSEMKRRGYKHASPLTQPTLASHQSPEARVDRDAALTELLRRCPECAVRQYDIMISAA